MCRGAQKQEEVFSKYWPVQYHSLWRLQDQSATVGRHTCVALMRLYELSRVFWVSYLWEFLNAVFSALLWSQKECLLKIAFTFPDAKWLPPCHFSVRNYICGFDYIGIQLMRIRHMMTYWIFRWISGKIRGSRDGTLLHSQLLYFVVANSHSNLKLRFDCHNLLFVNTLN